MTLIHGRSHAREVVDETLALHVVYPLSFIFYDCDVHVTGADQWEEVLPSGEAAAGSARRHSGR